MELCPLPAEIFVGIFNNSDHITKVMLLHICKAIRRLLIDLNKHKILPKKSSIMCYIQEEHVLKQNVKLSVVKLLGCC